MRVSVHTATPSVMASGVTGSVSVALHPLVILNISDHWIRMRSQEGRPIQVIGALIGKQEGRNIEVMNSFELLSHSVEEKIVIDKEYYYTKEEQFKQVFKDMEFLGWYTTGGPPDESDIHVHKQVIIIIIIIILAFDTAPYTPSRRLEALHILYCKVGNNLLSKTNNNNNKLVTQSTIVGRRWVSPTTYTTNSLYSVSCEAL
uniref:COP9 signalosome complex subunit 6 n=1 Tax=Callorhinchus milii TaxID=7868 RepID=A0A4W3H6T6_CALMI